MIKWLMFKERLRAIALLLLLLLSPDAAEASVTVVGCVGFDGENPAVVPCSDPSSVFCVDTDESYGVDPSLGGCESYSGIGVPDIGPWNNVVPGLEAGTMVHGCNPGGCGGPIAVPELGEYAAAVFLGLVVLIGWRARCLAAFEKSRLAN